MTVIRDLFFIKLKSVTSLKFFYFFLITILNPDCSNPHKQKKSKFIFLIAFLCILGSFVSLIFSVYGFFCMPRAFLFVTVP
jgi:hypothetical protein